MHQKYSGRHGGQGVEACTSQTTLCSAKQIKDVLGVQGTAILMECAALCVYQLFGLIPGCTFVSTQPAPSWRRCTHS